MKGGRPHPRHLRKAAGGAPWNQDLRHPPNGRLPAHPQASGERGQDGGGRLAFQSRPARARQRCPEGM